MKLLPPLFPNSSYLSSFWWHSVVYRVSFLISFLALLSVLSSLIIFYDRVGFWNISTVETILTLPMIPFLLILFPPGGSMVINYSSSGVSLPIELGYYCLTTYFILWYLLPTILYRVFLAHFLRGDWNMSKSSSKTTKKGSKKLKK